MLITTQEYYMGRDVLYPEELTDAHRTNAADTVSKANQLLQAAGLDRRVVSGWRPSAINSATKGAAANSKHITCQAVDLEDNNNELKNWCLNNQDICAQIGLWFESPENTRTWVHAQTVAPPSGRRFFIP